MLAFPARLHAVGQQEHLVAEAVDEVGLAVVGVVGVGSQMVVVPVLHTSFEALAVY